MRPLRLLALAAGTLLAGCSFAPTYQAPAVAMPAAWRDKGPWQTGTPADQLSRGSWWRLFGDDTLSGLEVQVISANTTLAAALAHYDAERQLLVEARSGLFPSITGGGSMSRNRQSDNRPLRGSNQPDVYNADTVGLGLNYEADLWGQVRNQVDAGTATTLSAWIFHPEEAHLERTVRFAGGLILPGARSCIAGLAAQAPTLPLVEPLGPSASARQFSTTSAIAAAMGIGYGPMVAACLLKLERETGVHDWLATGGNCGLLIDSLVVPRLSYRPTLVLEGLEMLCRHVDQQR